ncbi:hypothetical protein OG871_37135 [Kitasatospora sp. NBC_00374]|uniref:hypothetical protein n=1 Tax=Kitasatospora sp. NBC_00374 TaxID=2975964 RepID=UPI00324FD15B
MTTPASVPAGEPTRAERLAALLEQTDPAARLRTGTSPPVHQELVPLLPDGGLGPGTAVEVTDAGLLLALAGGAGTWAAVVGMPDLGLPPPTPTASARCSWSTTRAPTPGLRCRPAGDLRSDFTASCAGSGAGR